MLILDKKKIKEFTRRLGTAVRVYRFAFAALLIPLSIRAIPELLAGPYPIGYDTITSYVPAMLDWKSGNLSGFHPIIGGWLIVGLLGVAKILTNADPLIIIKVAGPLLYGLLGYSEYYLARNALHWSNQRSFSLVLVASVYFVLMRMSMDLLGNILAMSLLLIAIAKTDVSKIASSHRYSVAYSLLVWLVALTHLLVGTILIAILSLEAIRSRRYAPRILLCITPAILEVSVSLVGMQLLGVSLTQGNGPTVDSLYSSVFPVYAFLPLLPLAFVGYRRLSNSAVSSWLLICCVGLIATCSPASISHEVVQPDRWSFMMSLPLAIYAVQGIGVTLPSLGIRFSRLLSIGSLLVILLLGSSYLILPAQQAFPYYRFFSPTSMLQSTVPVQNSQDLANAIIWLSNNIPAGAVFMTPHPMYGWAREFFHARNVILDFSAETNLSGALAQTLAKGYTQIYTVWWINGLGWYGDQNVPLGFVTIHVDGEMAVYGFS